MARQRFVHLHVHSEYSMLDGLGKLKTKGDRPGYVQRAKALGMSHLALTDHGNIMGLPEFYRECKEAGLNPILGEEFYFVESVDYVREEKKPGDRYHVVIIAKSHRGFEVLTDLSTEAHKHYYYKPVIDRSLIDSLSPADRSELVVLSGCAGSILSKKVMNGDQEAAEEEAHWWAGRFPNYYIELQHHGTEFDRQLNHGLTEIASLANVPYVITNDPHFVMRDECDSHDALLAIQTASDIDDPNRFRFDGKGYHLRSHREMEKIFTKRYPDYFWEEGWKNTLKIAKQCEVTIPSWETRSWHIPKFPKARNAYSRLRRLAEKGLREKGLDGNDAYFQRMNYELQQFEKVGMSDFLLIAQDLIAEANRRGFRTGPGRGSVCCTLVGYLIGIHKIDSVKYDLLFERFLNPERPKMPDIDMDFVPAAREPMFEYAKEVYGPNNVMHVAAYQTMKAKRAFQALGRAHGISFQQRLEYSDLLSEDDDGNLIVPDAVRQGFPDLTETLDDIVGLKSSISAHPAGVLIFSSDDPIRRLVPEMWVASSKRMVSQYDLRTAELLGLMKQDFLGLRTLDTIEVALRFIKERHGVDLEPDDWVPDEEQNDAKVYAMLARGKTAGVFQMEGGTNHRGIQEIKPSCFEDIVSCTSLYRAGPMIAGAPDRFLKNRDDSRVRVAHPTLRSELSKTWGEMIYQEQMFAILYTLAGFSWSRVDDAKTAMTRKDAEKMAVLKEEAVEGFQKVAGMPAEKAEEVWGMIAAQAQYLFNRSHAVAYSMLTYQTARLKYLYPLEYLAAALATVEDEGKRYSYLAEAVERGFKIQPPALMESERNFTPSGRNTIRFGLIDVKGIGPAVCDRILTERHKFASLDDVQDYVRNKRAVEALKEVGALECFGFKGWPEKQEALLKWQFHDPLANFREKWGKKVRRPRTDNGLVMVVGEIRKIERRKTRKDKRDFLVWTIQWVPGEEYTITLWEDADDHWGLQKGSVVAVTGRWSAQWRNVSVGDPEQVRVLQAVKGSTRTGLVTNAR